MARGSHARMQPRNSRGQFAPARVVFDLDSDESNSSEVREPRGKRLKGESSTPTLANKGTKEDLENKIKLLVESAISDATKKLQCQTKKACSRVDESFENLFKEIKYGVLQHLAHTNMGDSLHKLRGVFEKAMGEAKDMVISQATNTINELDELLESLFFDVKYAVEKPVEERKKKIKKTKK